MKSILRLLLPALFIISISYLGTSCISRKPYCANDTLKYQKKSRIKAYKPNSSRSPFVHNSPIRKKYVIKK